MAVLPLVLYPDPRLTQVSHAVESVTDETRALWMTYWKPCMPVAALVWLPYKWCVHQRILIMDLAHGSERYNNKNEDESEPLFMVNPEIIWSSPEKKKFEEGCLSFPGEYGKVTRAAEVTVKYLDYHGEEKILEASGLTSVCVQHEIDHLDGKVFVDYLSRVKREIITKRLRKRSD